MANILADIGSLANPYGVPSQGEWNLSRGIFNVNKQQLIFFYEKKSSDETGQLTAVDQISDSGGRRLAIYEYPYLDSQAVQDLGRKGETFTFNIKFFGLNYQTRFQDFLNIVVNAKDAGTLTHPVRGTVTARFKEYEFIHRYDEWNAITIKATFIEDGTNQIAKSNAPAASSDSALRSALQFLTDTQSTISTKITEVSALLLLPNQIENDMKTRLNSISTQVSGLLGQLASTFSSDKNLQNLASQASKTNGGVTGLSNGTVTVGNGQQASLPPVFQVGFDPTTQSLIDTNISNFVNSNQITPQQAVFSANQSRQAITAAINEINANMGNQGYDIMVQYRSLANSIQDAVQSCIASTLSLVKIYTVPNNMSLRLVAQNNGLDPDRQNDILTLNPFIGSINYIQRGTQIIVPSS